MFNIFELYFFLNGEGNFSFCITSKEVGCI